jgi:HSP20 family protein
MIPTIRRGRALPSVFENSDFDRLFNIALGGAPSLSGWSPAVDVKEDAEGFVVTAELPGLSSDEVEVSVENGMLSISGEKRDLREEGSEESNYHLVERRFGRFQRNFSLPRTVDPAKVEANYDNGVLTVSLPKAAAAKPRKIAIKS